MAFVSGLLDFLLFDSVLNETVRKSRNFVSFVARSLAGVLSGRFRVDVKKLDRAVRESGSMLDLYFRLAMLGVKEGLENVSVDGIESGGDDGERSGNVAVDEGWGGGS